MIRIKICGITNYDDARLCDELGFDAIGFVFYNKSKRYVSFEEAKNICENISPFIMKVGVFVNEKIETINAMIKYIGLNAVQLHGEEGVDYLEKINCKTIKAFKVSEDFNFEKLSSFKQEIFFLFDSYDEKNYGGLGKTFNWQLIPNTLREKCILAGGLDNEKILKAFNSFGFKYFDLSSSVEKYPGKKDKDKLLELYRTISKLKHGDIK